MYTDEEERKGLPIKTFIISLILIIILVLLLVWLLPMPNMKGINDRIFNANIQEMKKAAIPYFTTEKLPQEIGDEVTLTLQEMIDLKLLLPFTDKNGDSCDTEKSYVTLTKKENSYEMKVNLKCNEEEDYILVTLGCYSYCTTAICEKEEPDIDEEEQVQGPSCVLYVSSGTSGSNGWYNSNAVVKFKSKTTTTPGATITNYGLGTGSVDYNSNDSYTVTNEGSTTVYGYVKDSTGKTAICSIVVKKDTVKPSCSLGVLSGTKGQDGSYVSDVIVGFSSNTDATSGTSAYGITNSSTPTYNNKTRYTINTNGTHKVYGYVKDNAGNTAICSITVEKRNGIEYQYKKEIPAEYSSWGEWTTSTYNPEEKPPFGSYNLIEIVDLGKTQEVDYYQYLKGEPIYKDQLIKVGTINQTYCSGYDYYRTTTSTTTTTYAIKTGEDWQYVGRVTTSGVPTDTLAVKYELVGLDWSDCGTGCTRAPRKIWNKYTRTVSIVSSSNTIVTSSGVTVSCSSTESKSVEIFGIAKALVGYEEIRTPVYKDVYKYKQRRRTLVKEAYTDYKWGVYNDKSLLEQGYTMTGVTRVAD